MSRFDEIREKFLEEAQGRTAWKKPKAVQTPAASMSFARSIWTAKRAK